MASDPWPVRSLRHDLALAFAAYALLAYAAIVVARQPGTIAVVWLANGAAAGLILSAPAQRTFWLLVAGVAGNLAANLAYGDPWHLSTAFLLPNAAEVMLAVTLTRRAGGAPSFANDHRRFAALLWRGALVPPLLGATVGAALLQAAGFGEFRKVWIDWYVGAALGSAAVLPLMLALRATRAQGLRERWREAANWLPLLLLPGLAAAALMVTVYPFVLMAVGMLTLAFLRPRIVTFAAAPLLVAVLACLIAWGWHVPVAPNTPAGHAMVYIAALLVVLPAQLVAVVVARQRALGHMLAAVGSRDDDILTFIDAEGRLRWANRARELYRGTPNEQVLGRHVGELQAGEQVSATLIDDYRLALAGQTQRQLRKVAYPLKGLRTMAVTVQPATDEEGGQIGVLVSARDVTELETQRQALADQAEALERSNQRLEQFVRIAAHDLREPLNTVVQFLGLIREQTGPQMSESSRLYFDHAEAGAHRLRGMLDDVLTFVRTDRVPDQAPAVVDLDRLVAEVLDSLEPRLQACGGEVVAGPLGTACGHRTLLMLAVQNLVSNATKFVAPGVAPRVTIEVQRTDGALRLTVGDNGIGIEAERLKDLGEPFRRLHSRRRFAGTGLGLANCRRVAELHGGRLDVVSDLGRGSRFTIALPDLPMTGPAGHDSAPP